MDPVTLGLITPAVIAYFMSGAHGKVVDGVKNAGVIADWIRGLRPVENERTHYLLLDGDSRAGKSAFLTRITRPLAMAEDIQRIPATHVTEHFVSRAHPIAIAPPPEPRKKPVMHMLRVADFRGESPSQFLNAVEEMNGQLARTGQESRSAIVLMVIDINESIEKVKSIERGFLDLKYKNRNARDLIKSVIVFLNKTDLLTSEQRDQYIADYSDAVRKILKNTFEEEMSVELLCGSALEGSGIHDCYATILRAFELDQLLEPIVSE